MDEPFSCPGCHKPECVCDERQHARENWSLLCRALAHGPTTFGLLSTHEERQVRRLGDGFGQVTDGDELWDWSHVRDSSAEAKELMADKIRDFLTQAAATN